MKKVFEKENYSMNNTCVCTNQIKIHVAGVNVVIKFKFLNRKEIRIGIH